MASNILVALSLLLVSLVAASPASDKVTYLPNFNGNLGEQYSGYITVDPAHGRALHYWFVASQNNPANDPVVLWMNGGPGCSSMDGFWYEHGPLHFGSGEGNLTVIRNPWTWTRVASVIYLEAPAGVGFSYSNTSSDYHTNDTQTAHDNYDFLKLFFQQFPQYFKNDFYISGESYAGIYVPTLAQVVMNGIQSGDTKINFKGVLVGNGVTDGTYDGLLTSFVPFAWGHGLISTETYNKINQYCPSDPDGDDCQNQLSVLNQNFNDIDIYDVYTDCFHQRPQRVRPAKGMLGSPVLQFFSKLYEQKHKAISLQESKAGKKRRVQSNPPCTDGTKAEKYLNLPTVKQAIHVKPNLHWALCSDRINYDSQFDTVIPIYKQLIANKYRILIYSGEADGAVPYTGSQAWTSSLNLPRKTLWREWLVDNGNQGEQVAGYVTEYEGLTFATVKGAGHMVPQFKPLEGYYMFQRFIQGQAL